VKIKYASRQTGKTTDIVRWAQRANNRYIACATCNRRDLMIKKFGIDRKKTLLHYDFTYRTAELTHVRNLYPEAEIWVDDAELLIAALLPKVTGVTIGFEQYRLSDQMNEWQNSCVQPTKEQNEQHFIRAVDTKLRVPSVFAIADLPDFAHTNDLCHVKETGLTYIARYCTWQTSGGSPVATYIEGDKPVRTLVGEAPIATSGYVSFENDANVNGTTFINRNDKPFPIVPLTVEQRVDNLFCLVNDISAQVAKLAELARCQSSEDKEEARKDAEADKRGAPLPSTTVVEHWKCVEQLLYANNAELHGVARELIKLVEQGKEKK
jgi:hypothetical protein